MAKHEKQEEQKKKGGFFRTLLKVIGWILGIVVLLFVGLIGFLSVTEYKPAAQEDIAVEGQASGTVKPGDDMTLMTWNLGYGALGDNADFFMDGGSSVYTADEARVNSNMAGIIENIKAVDPDIAMLQETDKDSDRSHHVNEYQMIQNELPDHTSSFANNFKVTFLPYPVPPIGKVDSGIATFMKYQPTSAQRVQLPISFKWPIRMANLKRCLLIDRVPVEGTDKELVIVNLHLEAYDSGDGKIAQTKRLVEILKREYDKGNYVIAGGDLNQIFSSEDIDHFEVKDGLWAPGVIGVTLLKGRWWFLMDEKVPSCRSLDKAYEGADKENFQYYLIDGFIISGNMRVKNYETMDLGFKNTDHNPVVVNLELRKNADL